MNKDMNKKISSTIIKMIAIIVSIFVFSYAWFVHNENTHINAIEIGTAKTNNIQVVRGKVEKRCLATVHAGKSGGFVE